MRRPAVNRSGLESRGLKKPEVDQPKPRKGLRCAEVQDPLRDASSVADPGTCGSRHASSKHETGRKVTLLYNFGEGSGARRLP